MRFELKNIFSVKNNDINHKLVTFLGKSFKLKYKRHLNQEDLGFLAEIFQQNITTAYLHQKVFPKYKNIYQGKVIVLCGAGPSLSKYNPIKEAVHIALNRAFLFEKVKFDYIFAQDWRGISHITEELRNYNGNNCIKFLGTQNGLKELEIPESFVATIKHERFMTDTYKNRVMKKSKFAFDLSTQPLGNFSTIALPAMQFILWTNPSKVYIVGCDSAPVGHYDGVVLDSDRKSMLNGVYGRIVEEWKELKEFAAVHYPDTEIISVNPVGLRGIFKDIYTKEGV